jgi:hypothetical protein
LRELDTHLEQDVLSILDIQTIVIVVVVVYCGNIVSDEHAKSERVQPAGYSTMSIKVVKRKTCHCKTNSMVVLS